MRSIFILCLSILLCFQGMAQIGEVNLRQDENSSWDEASLEQKNTIENKISEVVNKYQEFATLIDGNDGINRTSISTFQKLFLSDGVLIYEDFRPYPTNVSLRDYTNTAYELMGATGIQFNLSDVYIRSVEYSELYGLEGRYKIELVIQKVMLNGLNEDNQVIRKEGTESHELTMRIEINKTLEKAIIIDLKGVPKVKEVSQNPLEIQVGLGADQILPSLSNHSGLQEGDISGSSTTGWSMELLVKRRIAENKKWKWVAGLRYQSLGWNSEVGDDYRLSQGSNRGPWDVTRMYSVPNDKSLVNDLKWTVIEVPLGLEVPIIDAGYRYGLSVGMFLRPSIMGASSRTSGALSFRESSVFGEDDHEVCEVPNLDDEQSISSHLNWAVSLSPMYFRKIGATSFKWFLGLDYTYRLGNGLGDDLQEMNLSTSDTADGTGTLTGHPFYEEFQPHSMGVRVGLVYELTRGI